MKQRHQDTPVILQFQMLRQKSKYITKSLNRIEKDLLDQYDKGKELTRSKIQFIKQIRQLISLHEIIVNQIEGDLTDSDLQELGIGIKRIFTQLLSIIKFLVKQILSLFKQSSLKKFPSAQEKLPQNKQDLIKEEFKKIQHAKYELRQIFKREEQFEAKQTQTIWNLLNKDLKKQIYLTNIIPVNDQSKLILQAYNYLIGAEYDAVDFMNNNSNNRKQDFTLKFNGKQVYQEQKKFFMSLISIIYKLQYKVRKMIGFHKTVDMASQTTLTRQQIHELQINKAINRANLERAYRHYANENKKNADVLAQKQKQILALKQRQIELQCQNNRLKEFHQKFYINRIVTNMILEQVDDLSQSSDRPVSSSKDLSLRMTANASNALTKMKDRSKRDKDIDLNRVNYQQTDEKQNMKQLQSLHDDKLQIPHTNFSEDVYLSEKNIDGKLSHHNPTNLIKSKFNNKRKTSYLMKKRSQKILKSASTKIKTNPNIQIVSTILTEKNSEIKKIQRQCSIQSQAFNITICNNNIEIGILKKQVLIENVKIQKQQDLLILKNKYSKLKKKKTENVFQRANNNRLKQRSASANNHYFEAFSIDNKQVALRNILNQRL